MNIEIAKLYFESWSNKDLNRLDELLSDDCILEDWKSGLLLKRKLKITMKIFNENEVKLEIIEILELNDSVSAKIEIFINDKKIKINEKLNFKKGLINYILQKKLNKKK